MIARQQLERNERRAADCRTLVLEPTLQQLELLPVAELTDRAIRDRANPVVGVARRALDLVCPFATQVGNRLLVAGRRELVGVGRRFLEIHDREATGYWRGSEPM